jgi:hypothetical protein
MGTLSSNETGSSLPEELKNVKVSQLASIKKLIAIPRPSSIKDKELASDLLGFCYSSKPGTSRRTLNRTFCDYLLKLFSEYVDSNPAIHSTNPFRCVEFEDLFNYVIEKTNSASDLILHAKAVKWFAYGCYGYYPIIQRTFLPFITKHKSRVKSGAVQIKDKSGSSLRGNELMKWINRCPTYLSDMNYFYKKFMFYLPGFVLEKE